MDFSEKLIEEVRNNDIIYNLKSKEYKNTIKKEVIWAEIAVRLNSSIETCKKKWKSLRDAYKRKKQSSILPSGSQAPDAMEKWIHYESMKFLDNVECSRRTIGNVLCPHNSIEVLSDDTNDDNTITSPPAKKRKQCTEMEDKLTKFIEAAEKKLRHDEEDSVDELFSVLSRKVKAANLSTEQKNDMEISVTNLVYSKLAAFKNNDENVFMEFIQQG